MLTLFTIQGDRIALILDQTMVTVVSIGIVLEHFLILDELLE